MAQGLPLTTPSSDTLAIFLSCLQCLHVYMFIFFIMFTFPLLPICIYTTIIIVGILKTCPLWCFIGHSCNGLPWPMTEMKQI